MNNGDRKTMWVQRCWRWMWVLFLCLGMGTKGWAHGGEDHAEEGSHASPVPVSAKPTIETASEQIELLGMFDHGELVLYVDDFATNAPLTGASVEISADQNSVKVVERAAGEYHATLSWVTSPGHYPLTFVVESETVTDLLQATLDTQMAGAVPHVAPKVPGAAFATQGRLYWAGAGLAVVIAVMVFVMRRRPAVLVIALLLMPAFSAPRVWAHGGEVHAEDATPAQASGDTPRRLPDGRVFIPKATQRLLAMRTLLAREESNHRSVTLNGRVIADPSASGVVQASQAGKIDMAPEGFPVLGQQVRAGQVLAYLAPLTTSLERGNQQALLADMDSQLALAESKRTRLQSLVGSVPQKDIEAAQLEAASLKKRRDAVAASLFRKEPLIAPVGGVISASEVVTGQVVSEGALLFTVIQPDRLWVEALSYDPLLMLGDEKAVALAGSVTAPLTRVGRGAALRDQSIPLHFRMDAPVPALPVGQPVTVLVKTQALLRGIPVPAEAMARNAEGQWIVWIHEKAEVFKPVPVKSELLDGSRVMLTEGVAPGVRIVSAGAASLVQIR